MTIGYVMNSYPMVSTTFIGREILALEARGLAVRRYAIRPWDGPLTDPDDLAERKATTYLLTGSQARLVRAVATEVVTNPGGALRGLRLAMRLCRNARGAAPLRLVRHMAYLIEAMALKRFAARDGVTHLHAHFSSNSTSVAMLAHAMGGPGYSFTLHGPTDFFSPHEDSLGTKVDSARFVACISHFARAQGMIFAQPAHWDRMRIVHCGVDPTRYAAAPDHVPGERMLFVGRLAAVKGIPVLLRAMAAMVEARPDARLILVGDGPERAQIEALARDLGIADRVEFLGYLGQAEVADQLARADVFVLPSFAEGVPVVLMEAMASGVPVVATRVAGVGELVEDGVSGRTVPPGDPVALRAALEDVLSDADLRAAMGRAGRAKVAAEFDVATEAARLDALFDDPRAALPAR